MSIATTSCIRIMVLLSLSVLSYPCMAGMTWSARAIDPALIGALKSDNNLLDRTLFGEETPIFTEKLKKEGHVDLSDKQIKAELQAWAAKRRAEVGDTEIDLDKSWHAIHYLLTGSADSNNTLASKVIMGGEGIGPDRGYGPAQMLTPVEVKAIAHLLEQTSPQVLRKRYRPKEMTQAQIYPGDIWERDGDEALNYVLENYAKLIQFYKRAASRGQAVILVIT
jgi:hypothetical protein